MARSFFPALFVLLALGLAGGLRHGDFGGYVALSFGVRPTPNLVVVKRCSRGLDRLSVAWRLPFFNPRGLKS